MLEEIIDPGRKYPNVLIYVSKNDKGEPIVVLHAFGKIIQEGQEDCEDMVVLVEVPFPTFDMAKNYVKDFSTQTAIYFCEENNIHYQEM